MIRHDSTALVKTKILCTLGPATSKAPEIKDLIKAGMDGVRLNFSHGTHEDFDELFIEIDRACKDMMASVPILVDLQGPKIRIGELEEPEIEISQGDRLTIDTDPAPGNCKRISTSYKELAGDANIGDMILIDDGLLRMKIVERQDDSVSVEVLNGGTLKPRKGMNLPDMKLSTPSVTEKDYDNLAFALKHRVDYVALSFVRHPDDITGLRAWMKERGHRDIPIIAKIEKKEAVALFDEILTVADGIMVARGDLGVEMDPQDVPIVQKHIINRCNAAGKLVITATQMLESMIQNPIPTRAEASDVANAVWDGTDVVMLSGETSVGHYPVRTVQVMNSIVSNAEKKIDIIRQIEYDTINDFEEQLFHSVNKAVAQLANEVKASIIAVVTKNGRAAQSLSKYRPEAFIIAFSNDLRVINQLSLKRGIIALYLANMDFDEISLDEVKDELRRHELTGKGEVFVFTSGAPLSEAGRVNALRVDVM